MDVEVDDEAAAREALPERGAGRDGKVVEDGEAAAVAREGVVRPPPHMARQPFPRCDPSRCHGPRHLRGEARGEGWVGSAAWGGEQP